VNKKYTYLIIVLLILISFIAFGRSLGNDFVNYDDNLFIIENNHIKAGFNTESIKWAFTTTYVSKYFHPPVWLSYILDWSLFGANAGGYHLVSLLWHIGSVILLFLFLSKTTGSLWPSAFAAAFFAIHPLRVESVAWVAERRDVLSVFFGMATIYAYAYYAEKPKLAKYFLCLILFVLALMSKPMLVTLPCVLLLLDYWPLGRLKKGLTPQSVPVLVSKGTGQKKSKKLKVEPSAAKSIAKPVQSNRQLIGKLLWEKVPFFFLALAWGIIVIGQVQEAKLFAPLQKISFSERILNAIVSYVAYLGKTFCPVDLAVFYPYVNSFPVWQVLGATALLLGISASVIYLARKAPFLAVGWLWYLGVLFPVIGLMQAGDQAIADRYTYFPSIGIAIMLTWGSVYLSKEKLHKIILLPVACIVLCLLTILTWQQCGYWKNGVVLFEHVLQITTNNGLAHHNLGFALAADGKNEEAVTHYLAALKIDPNDIDTHYCLAISLDNLEKVDAAITHYREALRINPYYSSAHINLGLDLAQQTKYDEAIYHYRQALRTEPNEPGIYLNIGAALIRKGKLKEAEENFRHAVYLKPDYEDAHRGLSLVLDMERKQNAD
jgi:Flp pilus assembly protein TadD